MLVLYWWQSKTVPRGDHTVSEIQIPDWSAGLDDTSAKRIPHKLHNLTTLTSK